MSLIKYDYTSSWNDDGTIAKTPLLEIEVVKNTRNFKSLALVDSGSYMTLMNGDIADFLGIEESKCPRKQVGGITGNNDGFVCDVDLYIKHFQEKITMPVLFLRGLRVSALLGHAGFFDSYRVKFEKDHDIFELSQSPLKKYRS